MYLPQNDINMANATVAGLSNKYDSCEYKQESPNFSNGQSPFTQRGHKIKLPGLLSEVSHISWL